jgi:hypothetical protein
MITDRLPRQAKDRHKEKLRGKAFSAGVEPKAVVVAGWLVLVGGREGLFLYATRAAGLDRRGLPAAGAGSGAQQQHQWQRFNIAAHHNSYFNGTDQAFSEGAENKNAFFRAFFILQNDHFTKTGSGQTYEKLRHSGVFLQRLSRVRVAMLRRRCENRISFAMPFCTANDQFTKTGSGQT